MRWDIDNVKGAYLDGAGRPGHSSERICPSQTHTYTLKVILQDGQARSFELAINVLGSLPLSIDYQVANVWCPTRFSYAIDFSIGARGGKGNYIYYRDIDKIGGPTAGGISYRLYWTSCGAAPGTFIVRSGDGQEARKEFWVNPPTCCK